MCIPAWFTKHGQSFSSLLFIFLVPLSSIAQEYPDMLGTWRGDVRVVQTGVTGVAKGGMLVSDVNVILEIEHQEGESFMGSTRNSQMPSDQPGNRVWGTIRSTGKEAIFITSTGARGQLWFANAQHFEFCITNLQEDQATAYCANLEKDP